MTDITTVTAGVVGAGPAGLIAAETLAAAGIAVTVFEHRRSPANKFVLAGRGGLNITNSEPLDELLDRYGPDRAFVEPAVRAWPSDELRQWIDGLGEPAFVGSSGRVFPASMRATPLLRAWLARLGDAGVSMRTGQRWVGFGHANDEQRFVEVRAADAVPRVETRDVWLFAMGGASWPRVGSDGSWLNAFAAAGIDLAPIEASNCGVRVTWTQVMQDRFAGEPLKNIAVQSGRATIRGDMVVTTEGLEGGPVYGHSRSLRTELRTHGTATLLVDLQPDLTAEALHDRLRKRGSGATATTWLRGAGLAAAKVALLREVTSNQLPTNAGEMAALIKRCEVTVHALAPIDRAISTAGGIAQNAVDEQFMLRARDGVFVAGEMIDWDAPTGGYLLQASLSMGVAAARGMQAWLARA